MASRESCMWRCVVAVGGQVAGGASAHARSSFSDSLPNRPCLVYVFLLSERLLDEAWSLVCLARGALEAVLGRESSAGADQIFFSSLASHFLASGAYYRRRLRRRVRRPTCCG